MKYSWLLLKKLWVENEQESIEEENTEGSTGLENIGEVEILLQSN